MMLLMIILKDGYVKFLSEFKSGPRVVKMVLLKKKVSAMHILICFMSPPSSLLRCKIDDLSSVSEVGECLIARMIYAPLCKPFLINPLGGSSNFHQIKIVICNSNMHRGRLHVYIVYCLMGCENMFGGSSFNWFIWRLDEGGGWWVDCDLDIYSLRHLLQQAWLKPLLGMSSSQHNISK